MVRWLSDGRFGLSHQMCHIIRHAILPTARTLHWASRTFRVLHWLVSGLRRFLYVRGQTTTHGDRHARHNTPRSPIGGWLGSRVVSVLDSGAEGHRVQIAVATLSGNSRRQTVHTHRASVHQAAKLVAALLRVAGVTAGLAGSNGRLPPGLRLTSPPGWLPRTWISSGTLRSIIEYGLPSPFYCCRGRSKKHVNSAHFQSVLNLCSTATRSSSRPRRRRPSSIVRYTYRPFDLKDGTWNV